MNTDAPANLDQIERKLGHTFKNKELLERALTHRSWAHEQVVSGSEDTVRHLHNEALEFVGDAVLGCVVAEYLFHAYPHVTEGELSRMKHRLVSANTLAQAAERMELGAFLRVGRGEEKTGGRRKQALLSDAFEAVLAAIFFDGGFEAARAFIEQALGAELQSANPEEAAAADYKTMLQERLQAERRDAPRYIVVETVGPPHRRIFHVEVMWQGGKARAEGSTIKSAEMAAACRALELLANIESDRATLDSKFKIPDSK